MNKIFMPILIILLVGVSGCSSKHKTIEKFNNSIFKELPGIYNASQKEFIILIPNQGCGGCITVAENFYKQYQDREQFLFIFTNVISRKMLAFKVQINPGNTLIDTDDNFLKLLPQKERIYPCILYVREGRIEALFYQSPKEAGFEIVKQLMHQHEEDETAA